jgi:hypothetical protein
MSVRSRKHPAASQIGQNEEFTSIFHPLDSCFLKLPSCPIFHSIPISFTGDDHKRLVRCPLQDILRFYFRFGQSPRSGFRLDCLNFYLEFLCSKTSQPITQR